MSTRTDDNRLERLEAEVENQRRLIEQLRAQDGDGARNAEHGLSRRAWLRSAGVAAAGAVVGAVASASPAQATAVTTGAADGDALQIGGANTNTAGSLEGTQLSGSTLALFGPGPPMFRAANTGEAAVGVSGVSDSGAGVSAESASGPGLLIVSTGLTIPPTTGFWRAGSFVVTGGQLWYCYVTGEGSASQWARLSSPFVPAAAPVRVYDSRPGEAPLGVTKGQLNPGQERVVDVGLNGAVPTTASAVLCNLSVVSTVNAGFLAMFKEDVPYPGHSSVNWSASNQITGNNATSAVAVDGAEVNVRVRCGGSGGTQFVVDVLGHYL